jgi:hypothetical protein
MARKQDDQRDFYPAWEERTRELRARLRSIEPGSAGLSPRRWEQVRELLMAVASYERRTPDGERQCRQAAEKLLATARLGTRQLASVGQLYAARREAERLGLLGSSRNYAGGVRGEDLLWVVDARIEELAAATRGGKEGEPPDRTNPNQPKPTRTNSNQLEPRRRCALFLEHSPKVNANSPDLSRSTPSSPSLPLRGTTSTSARLARPATEPDWLQAEEEVFLFGMTADYAARGVAACATITFRKPEERIMPAPAVPDLADPPA